MKIKPKTSNFKHIEKRGKLQRQISSCDLNKFLLILVGTWTF